ncbi:MAG: hypothetical protein HYX34_13615 [Actinobacteria bacterium]|nr:hypothetical protein [Actinomycetota bacterium]
MGWFARLWVLGIVAVGVVTLLTLATGPGDLPALARLFVWASTAAFSVYLVREHRSRLPRRHRLLLFAGCAACVLLLTTALVVTAF